VAQKAKRAAMLLWAGSIFLIMGAACLVIDRASAHFFYEHVIDGFFRFADRTTHLAKGSHWLTAAIVVYLAAETGMHFRSGNPGLHIAAKTSLAFLACLTAGSAVLHIVKRILARRRPRDELEMGLYGFIPFSLDAQYNSFPSGHALTITCVAQACNLMVRNRTMALADARLADRALSERRLRRRFDRASRLARDAPLFLSRIRAQLVLS
jgi:membrane-associated phospholipid phosphatase